MPTIESIFENPSLMTKVGERERARLLASGIPVHWSENGRHIRQNADGSCQRVSLDADGNTVPGEFLPAEDCRINH